MVSKFYDYNGNVTFMARSTDTINTMRNGNIRVDVDTGEVKIYNEDTNTWELQFSLQGE